MNQNVNNNNDISDLIELAKRISKQMRNIEWELENLDLNQKEKISLRGSMRFWLVNSRNQLPVHFTSSRFNVQISPMVTELVPMKELAQQHLVT
jgi:hypothetical protein